MRKTLIIAAAILLAAAISACGTTEPRATQQQEMEQTQLQLYGLPSDGLAHEPYGWDNLYGSKEVPEKWWQRSPRDPKAGEEVEINVSVGTSLKDKDIWLEWSLNGELMEPVKCSHRANVSVDGVERLRCIGKLGSFDTGDRVEYTVCAGTDGKAEKQLGIFEFSISEWQTFIPESIRADESGLVISGSAGGVEATARAELSYGVLSLTVEDGAEEPDLEEAGELSLTSGGLKAEFAEDSCAFSAELDGRELLSMCEGLELLTDGADISGIRLSVAADRTDAFYGFGMRYDSLDQRGKTVDIYCVNWYTQQQGESYTPVPFYFVPDKYGLFVDSTCYSRFAMCSEREDACVVEVYTEGDGELFVPFHFITGDNADILSRYSELAGKAELPPAWAFGPWISANEWNRQSEIMEQLDATLENRISTSVIVIEAWSDEETFYIWNDAEYEPNDGSGAFSLDDFTFSGRWPDPAGMVDELHENGIKVLLWQIPVLKYSATAPVQSMRDQFYAEDMGYVFSREDGSVYRMPSGTWFGSSLLVDFTDPEAASWFLEKRRYLIDELGVDGFKTDGGEFVWGSDVVASNGLSGRSLRNAYPDAYAQAYYDFINADGQERVTFSRAGGSSMQTHPLCWIGDQLSDEKAFKSAIIAAQSASMSGIPFVAWDIAGFSGDVPTTELYCRSAAQAAFSPVMQLHSETSGDPSPSVARTPWNMAERKGSDTCLEVYKYYANLRMNLLPYIYSEAAYSSESGEPLMRSMAYEFPADGKAAEYEYQYMLGRSLLVAPVTEISSGRVEVYLPEGEWYGFFDGELYEPGTHIFECELDEIPVFVRAGSVIPLNTVDGKLGSYVGNDTESYSDLEFWSFADGSEYDWFDYVSGEQYTLNVTDEYTKLAVPYEYSVRCFAA